MLQQLLQASQSDMQRICAASPSLLVRDPAQLRDKLERYAGLLQLPLVSRWLRGCSACDVLGAL